LPLLEGTVKSAWSGFLIIAIVSFIFEIMLWKRLSKEKQ
jgi:hypothetical protein